jgi:hypothetical protein
MKIWIGVAVLALAPACMTEPPAQDVATLSAEDAPAAQLRQLGGCFAVDYEFLDSTGAEFFLEDNVEYIDVQPDAGLVRNVLVLPQGTAFLHWVQRWSPLGDGRWQMRVEDGQGQLRYESAGQWSLGQWVAEASVLAEKPNRDRERTDYARLERLNRVQVGERRWIQSEANRKLDETGALVATELGWIVYTRRADDGACAPARELR